MALRKHKKEIGYDRRPRFGWCDDLDNDPQYIFEKRHRANAVREIRHPVAVIPLPFMSAKQRTAIREFVEKHWSGIPCIEK